MSIVNDDGKFPCLTPDYILAFQFSNWYPSFTRVSPKSTIIRPLGEDFKHYLESDSIFVPEGSEDVVVESTLSDNDTDDEREDMATAAKHFSFPELDERIRSVIREYKAVFPKLNFSSPKDASWVLPASSPLKCTSPADVYLLLKSSDFITHDFSIEYVFDGCRGDNLPVYELELVLRKWYPVDHSREVRCFVRNDVLLGITQRDTNFYGFMIDPEIQKAIRSTVCNLWEEVVRPNWSYLQKDYVFDLLLTRDLSGGHVIDFNPYAPHTDPLLFTYEELQEVLSKAVQDASARRPFLPELRVNESPTHSVATQSMPAYQHNRVPIEALTLSEGRNLAEFGEIWQEEVTRALREDDA
ncbi:D123-domain-containing protein [Pisolithus croceorrhizus]|nr:D123-domain-containing protein [Pisolithus croceorrhizus]KAI6122907.1 D123-domain-containing protein [Pisolithus croceorrhizus]